jgi:hypothetical protein
MATQEPYGFMAICAEMHMKIGLEVFDTTAEAHLHFEGSQIKRAECFATFEEANDQLAEWRYKYHTQSVDNEHFYHYEVIEITRLQETMIKPVPNKKRRLDTPQPFSEQDDSA